MVIDSHAHIGNLWVLNLNVRKVLWSMEQYGVDFSLVSSIDHPAAIHEKVCVVTQSSITDIPGHYNYIFSN